MGFNLVCIIMKQNSSMSCFSFQIDDFENYFSFEKKIVEKMDFILCHDACLARALDSKMNTFCSIHSVVICVTENLPSLLPMFHVCCVMCKGSVMCDQMHSLSALFRLTIWMFFFLSR